MSSVAQLLSGTGMTWGRRGSGVEETGEILCAGLREVVPPIQSLRCSKSITGVENTPQQTSSSGQTGYVILSVRT